MPVRTPGAFFRFSWGDVDFFVLDSRYYRSPNKAKDDDKKRMLGDPQFEWLLNGLKNSKAKFKILASGSTLHYSTADGWRRYTFARRRLFDAIKMHKISGVVFFSGDIHKSLVWVHHESERAGYQIIEVISSGIANSKTLSFATVDFDTTAADPTMRVRIILGNGEVRDEKTWKLSQLEVRDPPNIPIQQNIPVQPQDLSGLQSKLFKLREQRKHLLIRYTEKHPSVLRIGRRINIIEQQQLGK